MLLQEAAQLAGTSAACDAGRQDADTLPVPAVPQQEGGQGPNVGDKDASALQAHAAAGDAAAQPGSGVNCRSLIAA